MRLRLAIGAIAALLLLPGGVVAQEGPTRPEVVSDAKWCRLMLPGRKMAAARERCDKFLGNIWVLSLANATGETKRPDERFALPESLIWALILNDTQTLGAEDGKPYVVWGDLPTPTPTPTPRTTPRPTPRANTEVRCIGVTLWGCTAHREIAASRDCDDLQSWFDAADIQRSAYLRNYGNSDPNYRYAYDVMNEAHTRMRAIGCYG